ncbi:MAG: TIGR02996 domain-containing protein [Gemmataceae bacterium]|nr:TIGR02996 domain-containing protein [Gemmataceae bacterium]
MNHRRAFLDTIIETPDDDAPRLVFADWLMEQGDDARAEFIRSQIGLERMEEGDPRRAGLESRERELLHAHGWDWAEELGDAVTEWRYRRGFIEYAELSLEREPDEIGDLMARAPIRHIRVTESTDTLSCAVKALPHLRRLLGLEFWNLDGFDDADVEALLASRHLADLRTLILHQHRNGRMIDDDILAEAMHSPLRRNLRELGVNFDGVTHGPSVPVLLAIAGSDHLDNLRTLHLCHAGQDGRSDLPVEVLGELAESTNLAHLGELNLSGVTLPAEGWELLLASPFITRLNRLYLSWANVTGLNGYGFAHLEASPFKHRFDALGIGADWETSFYWHEEAHRWRGLTARDLRRHRLGLMAPYLSKRDLAGLERAFRGWCARHAGERAAQAIEALDLGEYERRWRRAIVEATDLVPAGGALAFRLGSEEWIARLAVHDEDSSQPTAWADPDSFLRGGTDTEVWRLPEAEAILSGFLPAQDRIAGSAEHYVLARIATAFVRALGDCAVPAYFIPDSTLFRIGRQP